MITRRTFLNLATTAAGSAILASSGLGLVGCSSSQDVLRVGTKIDVPGFGFQNPATGNLEGLEVDIARELARRIKGSEDALELTGVNVTTRGAMLDNGTLDAVLATFSITPERQLSYAFSRPYYVDHLGILVKKDAGYDDFTSLDGKCVGVALSATSKQTLQEAAEQSRMTLSFAEYSTYPEIKIALVAGRVDAFSVDQSILNGYVDDTTMLLPVSFAPQSYGVASSLSNPELAVAIDEAIGAMEEDGTLAGIKQKWNVSQETDAQSNTALDTQAEGEQQDQMAQGGNNND